VRSFCTPRRCGNSFLEKRSCQGLNGPWQNLEIIQDPFFFVKDTKRLTQSFTKLLPNYRQILTTHPELPYFYEKLLQYESSSKNSSQIIAED